MALRRVVAEILSQGDGDTRGGAALSVKEVTGVPINDTAGICQVGSYLYVKSYRALSAKAVPAPRLRVLDPNEK